MRRQSAAAKMKAYRARLRKAGLRPVQLWVPDTRKPGFAAEARRQSRLLARSLRARDEMDFVEALAAENINLPEE